MPFMRVLRMACPLAASICILVTIIACVVIVKVKHIWVSGLAWPFLSEMGRDPPAYYVFCAGLTLVAVLLVLTWTFNWQYHKSALLDDSTHLQHVAFICFLAGVVASPGLPILAFFDTSNYPTVHSVATLWFFCFETVALFLNTILSYKLYKLARARCSYGEDSGGTEQKAHKRKRTLVIQAFFLTCFLIAFVIYIPVGMSLAPQSKRLSVKDCLDQNLGATYCKETVRLNATKTKLYDDRSSFGVNQMSAAAQLACILSLVGYSISFATNDYEDTGAQQANQEHLIRSPIVNEYR